MKQANRANVSVVAFDRKPQRGSFKAFIGYNAIAAGKRAADALANALHNTGDVIEIEGILGTNVAQDRHTGETSGKLVSHDAGPPSPPSPNAT